MHLHTCRGHASLHTHALGAGSPGQAERTRCACTPAVTLQMVAFITEKHTNHHAKDITAFLFVLLKYNRTLISNGVL